MNSPETKIPLFDASAETWIQFLKTVLVVKVSDNRYRSDLRSLHLAHRLMHLEARTSTIRRWTGLSPYSVRTLHEAYCSGHYGPRLQRHRGVPPYLMRFFFRSPELRYEAAVLAGLCWIFGALPPERLPNARERLPTLVRGEQLCAAYEAFRALVAESAITLDHAVLLLTVLAERQEAALMCCPNCGGLTLIDCLALEDAICSGCAVESTHEPNAPTT